MDHQEHPVVVIGAGPIGLAAAAHLLDRGLEPLVLEAGASVGAHILGWSHVRTFSPWRYNVDRAATALLERHGWTAPDPEHFPTGREIVERYLRPLAQLPQLAPRIRTGARVVAVSRQRTDRMKSAARERTPFVVRIERDGAEEELLAQAVIDASGTWGSPNPLGSAGLPALGERRLAERIAYGIPDILGDARARYAGKRVLVVGSGHSAFNVLQELVQLAESAPGMQIHWAIRRASLARVLGGGENDALIERGRLGARIARHVQSGGIALHAGFRLERLARTAAGIVAAEGARALPPVDELVGVTGFRPALGMLAELRLDLDPVTESPRALAPLIDPNLHSCGTVRPHGAAELRHPEEGFYIAGMKSYGRAPTFLLLTGYEQVRSIASALAGDWEAARRVELELPATGVCSTQFDDEAGDAAGACCGPPPTAPQAPAPSCATSGGTPRTTRTRREPAACCA